MQLPRARAIGVIGQQVFRMKPQLIALSEETPAFRQDQSEHGNRRRAAIDREPIEALAVS